MRRIITVYRRLERAWCMGERPSRRHAADFAFELMMGTIFIVTLVLLPALLGGA